MQSRMGDEDNPLAAMSSEQQQEAVSVLGQHKPRAAHRTGYRMIS